MEETKLLEDIYNKEKNSELGKIQLFGIPVWRIVRYNTRLHYIHSKTGYIASSSPQQKVHNRSLKLLSGFWKYIGKDNLSVFFTFNRLINTNDILLDKFEDPLIELTDLQKSNYVIVDTPNYVGYYKRVHRNHSVSNEYRTLFMQILKNASLLVTPILLRGKICSLYSMVNEVFKMDSYQLKQYQRAVSLFAASYLYYSIWFRLLRPRRVFVVLREGYFPVIAACKKLGIPVAEFQHGITMDKTVSYTGDYDQRIDPDYFLVFGDYWKGPQFGMPLDRIINIGWAYSKYLQKTIVENNEKHDKEVLVISSPEISDAILDALQELSKNDADYSFDIRLHPCESYNGDQQEKLKAIPKAQVVDNKTDSALVLPTYKYVVGENSSVIYEALSVGCKVGMLNMCGLRPAIDLPGIKDNFFVINNREDFERFLTEDSNQSTSKAEFYSEFDSKRFMEFIENKM
jgi:hypothetical protein